MPQPASCILSRPPRKISLKMDLSIFDSKKRNRAADLGPTSNLVEHYMKLTMNFLLQSACYVNGDISYRLKKY